MYPENIKLPRNIWGHNRGIQHSGLLGVCRVKSFTASCFSSKYKKWHQWHQYKEEKTQENKEGKQGDWVGQTTIERWGVLHCADLNKTAVYHPLSHIHTRIENLTLRIHTHICVLQGTCKLEVEGCHLWLSGQKCIQSTHTQIPQNLHRSLRQLIGWDISCWHLAGLMLDDHITAQ